VGESVVAAIEARWVERGVLGRLAGGEDGDLAAGNVRKRRSRALRGAGGARWRAAVDAVGMCDGGAGGCGLGWL
jgi:hypothetical protein